MSYDDCACGRRKGKQHPHCQQCREAAKFHPRHEITESEIAWLAGILEGEGTWSGNGKSSWCGLNMTDEDIVRRLQKVTEVGRVTGPYFGKEERYKPYFAWRVSQRRELIWLCKLILPWMGERRTERIKESIRVAEAHLAEHLPSKQAVAGSTPVSHSNTQ